MNDFQPDERFQPNAALRFRKDVELGPEDDPAGCLHKLVGEYIAAATCDLHPGTRFRFNWAESCWYRPPPASGLPFRFSICIACPSCRAGFALCPPQFHAAPLGTFQTNTQERAAALARAREFVAQVNGKGCGWLLLAGKPGTGKTRLACGIVRELDRRALYARQGELTVALRATYGRREIILRRHAADDDGDETPPGPLELAQAAPFLILDELGCVALANDERLLLDEILKHRYDFSKPTALISNLPLTELRDFLGDAISDRITHATGNGKFIQQFAGDSFRRTSGEDYLAGPP